MIDKERRSPERRLLWSAVENRRSLISPIVERLENADDQALRQVEAVEVNRPYLRTVPLPT
jgi:hypothetical protein